jgi:CRISPR-associated protein Csd1
VFGRSIEPKDVVYLSKRKNAFVDLLQTCYDETRIESINTIISFLKLDVTLPENLNDTHCIYFEVIGHENFLENKAVQKFWAKSLYPEKTKDNLSKKQCLVTGEQSEIVDVVKIKIRCSQLSKDGLALITANNEVYEHYGMKQAYNSPISLDAVEKTHNLLNELFRSNKHSKKVGNNVYVFWAEQDPFLLFNDADPETVKEFFESYQSGKIWSDYKLDENDKFKIYGFSNISSRLVIKYANQLSMKQLYKNQHRWLQSIRLYNNGRNEFPELWKLMKAVYRKKDTKNAADYETSIMNSILDGRPLPAFILNTLVRRAILDIVDKNSPGISHTQISLIKACLYDKIKSKGYEMTSEQKDCKDIAYNLGRLWALVEKLQLEALGDRPNASITDKNFTSICTLPSRTIGRLQKNISYYLQLLRKKNVGKSIWLEREIAQVMETISVLPDRLTIEERGMFLIGYFHKQTSLYAPKAESTTETKTGEIENVATN